MAIGDRIRIRREELGLTQQQLADRLGYKSKSAINKIEMGINDVGQKKIPSFARALETSIEYLMEMEDVGKSQHLEHYTDPETAEIAQEIFDGSYLHALFRAARGSKPEDVQMVTEMLNRFKGTNPDG